MQSTSETYKALLAAGAAREVRLSVNGVMYGEDDIKELSTSRALFDKEEPTVGGAVAGQLDALLNTASANIPRMATLIPYVRLIDRSTNTASEWVQKGVYYIDTREEDAVSGNVTIHAFDAMLKADGTKDAQEYRDVTAFTTWPQRDTAVVNEIASIMDVDVDERTTEIMTLAYNIGYPNDYTMREMLQHIAAAYAGNFVISDTGELLLITLNSLPPETNLLADNVGNVLTFDGDAIILD